MDYDIGTQLNGTQILEIFIESGLHTVGHMKVNWSKPAVCVCLVTFLNWSRTLVIRQSTATYHAEHGIVEFLRGHIRGIRSVKIFCNYSPCSKPGYDCCSRIIKIKEDLKDQERSRDDGVRVGFIFVFSSLYNITRPSCWKRGCFEAGPNGHFQFRQDNYGGLGNLCSLGSSIRSFETADWVGLVELLALWDTRRKIETGILTLVRFGEKYGYWRDLEDAELKRDFQILKDNFLGMN